MNSEYLSVKNLSIQFDKTQVIKDMNFNIKENTLTTFLGPSGSGKTTALRAIAGLNNSITGQILLDGENIQDIPVNRRNIGMIFQSYALFPNLTVFDNVAYGLKVRKVSKNEIKKAVANILQTVSLEDRADYYPSDLSGGQKQRVAIARAMVLKPKLLLLDEPLSALDAKIRVNLRNQIKDYQKKFGITMIFVTHDQAEAMAISDDIVVIDNGKVQQHGSPEEIYASPKNDFIAKFIGNHNILSGRVLNDLGIYEGQDEDSNYIIRPEMISFNNNDGNASNYELDGTITDTSVLGDRIQYLLNINNNISLKVESLNHGNSLKPNDKIKVYLNKDDIKKVG